ncbi:MAG: hypothetical protein QM786_06610 [Breznakibacter sp.]
MNRYLLTLATIFTLTLPCFAQQSPGWEKWDWLLGQWQGEGNGRPGQGSGRFSFEFGLDNKIIVRKSHSEYPATENKPQIVHDDLMIVYSNATGNPPKAIYFDNEGHTINYTINYADRAIILTSDSIPHVPLFRLTYTLQDNGTVLTKFEMSRDGVEFMTYVEGTSKKL